MALIEKLTGKDVEEVYFSLTPLKGAVVYLKTKDYTDPRRLINDAYHNGLFLKQINTGADRPPIAHSPGYFVMAQIVNKATISVQQKLWSVIK